MSVRAQYSLCMVSAAGRNASCRVLAFIAASGCVQEAL